MRTSIKLLSIAVFTSSALSGCLLVPEQPQEPVVQTPVVVAPPPPPACYEVAALQRVEIPAETRTVVGISLIENPPYDPIETRTEQKIITKQAEVYYALVDPATGNQKEVTNLCDPAVPRGPVGPLPGEALGAPTTG